MAEFSFSLTDGNDPDEVKKMNKTLNWLMLNLDHSNVKRLHTEYCDIRSAAGETVIDGPLIKMTGASTVLRLKMGREGADFVFKLYNSTGGETVNLNSSGIISAYNFIAYDSLTVKQASVVAASITIGDGLGGVTPATITYSGQDVPVSDVNLTLNSVSNISLNATTAGGYVRLTGAETQVEGTLTVSKNLVVTGSVKSSNINSTGLLTVKDSISSSSITSNGVLNLTTTNGAAAADRVKGYTVADVFKIGSGACKIDVQGTAARFGNGKGYIQVADNNLYFVDSTGVFHTIY